MRERQEWEEGAAKERRRKEEAAKTSFKATWTNKMPLSDNQCDMGK
ncbi:hypothetical protein T4C_11287 [Trichinella pseudospiralis]|uniref:Uncharacterized protein n=1 Tax=Trichinella pseudospiralis TaxID=6337 RepID=A0A0V1HFX7_TRIPS|nr:hypothetical protein T4C_11287 [Trichinella pseudospiralis]